MAKKAQGLSPNFYSFISIDVPESLTFRWVFVGERESERQESATVRIYQLGSSSPFLTLQTESEEYISVEENIPSFVDGQIYEWDVETNSSNSTTTTSERAIFRFVKVPLHSNLHWPDGPVPYEYIGSRRYFQEIRENAISIMGDYILRNEEDIDALVELSVVFTGRVVPSREDFLTLEKVLHLIAEKEYSAKREIMQLIEDGLGASDIHKIYKILNELAVIPPHQPTNFSVVIEHPSMYQITEATAKNNGVLDTSIQTDWKVGKTPDIQSYIQFDDELNDDISYYEIEIITGFDDLMVSHYLYFRIDDLKKIGRKIILNLNQLQYEVRSKTRKAISGFSVVAVDKRRQKSINYAVIQPIDKLFLGPSHYILRNEVYDLAGASVVKPYGEDLYNGKNQRYTHNVSGDASGFYHYAVKVIDKGGEESDWYYFGPVKIDTYVPPEIPDEPEPIPPSPPEIPEPEPPQPEPEPEPEPIPPKPNPPVVEPPPIEPPAPPPPVDPPLESPKPIVSEIGVTSAVVSWKAVKNADSYEIQINNLYRITTTKHTYTTLKEATVYTVRVRSINKNTASDWTSVVFTTATKPTLTKEATSSTFKCWRSNYHIKYQNGNQTYPKGGWRNDVPNELIQGEWVELQNKVQDGLAVKAGTRWGNHKSIAILNYPDWVNTLKNKTIVKVEMYIKRLNTSHGFANDGRTLNVYTHNYSSIPSGEPMLANRHEVKDKDWDRGQGHWFLLPTKYGELIRDGKAKGLGIYHPNTYVNPPANYSYCRFDAKSFKLRIYYK